MCAIELIDGFDHYTTLANLRLKWDPSSSIGGGFTAGRFGGAAVRTGASDPLISRDLGAVATRVVGWALKYEGAIPSGSPVVMAFLDGTSTQVDLRVDSTGHFIVTRNGTVLATSSSAISGSTWYYIEFRVTVHSSAGAYRLDVSSGASTTTWLTATGVNTQATGNATMTAFKLLGGTGTWLASDDLYVLNSSGSVNNTLLGERRVLTTLASAEGASLQWTPNSGTTHYNRVNEADPDGDTTYVSSSGVGQVDTYQFPDITAGSVDAVQVTITNRKDDTGARTVCAVFRSGAGTNYDGTAFSPATSYGMNRQVWDQNPATSSAWSVATVNAGEFGIKVVS